MPIDDACPCSGGSGSVCNAAPHSVTGWCTPAGLPVIVLYTLDCTEPAATAPNVVGIFNAETGAPVAGPIRPCGNIDWEVTQWCDVDDNDDILSAYIVTFQWDEVTGTLTATTTLPDGVTPYVPVGNQRICNITTLTTDVEPMCYDVDANPAPGWQLIFIDPIQQNIVDIQYFTLDFTPLAAPTIMSCIEQRQQLTAYFGNYGVGEPDDATWTIGLHVRSVTVIVKEASPANPVTITTAQGARTIEQPGYVASWSIDVERDADLGAGAFTISAGAGTAKFDVLWTVSFT